MSDSSSPIVIPAEWAPHEAIWTAWPSHEELWQEDLEGARLEFTAMCKALAPDDTLKVLVCGDAAIASAQKAIGAIAEIVPAEFGDIWLRDTGPIFAKRDGHALALRFATNGWGGKYDLPGDSTVGDEVVAAAGVEVKTFKPVLEGGALEHNGAGTILTTRQCLLNPNRNRDWDQSAAEAFLQEAFHCQRVLWLKEGLLNDHTDGHIDNLVRFVGENEVVCQTASGHDDPNAALYTSIAEELRAMGFIVHSVPSPGKVCNADGDIVPASHMNFIVGNKTVVVPTYNDEFGDLAVSALQSLFPGRNVIGITSTCLLTGGGSFHCITQQQPA